ncbi:anthranilate synthase component I family protein [Parasediminibacterium paludis]|uniref:Anthranilate synthase component I family protein n=1 Tax=Parasediminibacterium paludis TaxID=908966 RepID=A0ABV8PUL7_9BACT
MQRATGTFVIQDFQKIKQQLLHWANQYDSCSFLDNHQYTSLHHSVECLVAVGEVNRCSPSSHHQQALASFLQQTNDWLFGHISYDFHSILYPSLAQQKPDSIGFQPIYFYQPEIVLQLSATELRIESLTLLPIDIYQQIRKSSITSSQQPITSSQQLAIQSRISKADYLQTIHQLQQYILRGDCYEINYCQEFYASNAVIEPLAIYQQLTAISPNPFASYYKLNDKYLLCASPERYLKKQGHQLISQPIKGTFKRNLQNTEADKALKQQLFASHKDRTENVMVVDLVRNDLSRICKEGTVQVEELFGIYTYPQVHQMISTIVGEIDESTNLATILQATFPMGSMTGAPKQKVMQLINEYEPSSRGLYSGAVGYISPNKDFDFNVVIRSILYNSTSKYLSYQVGGGITFNSIAEQEYEECLLKAEAIRKVLSVSKG